MRGEFQHDVRECGAASLATICRFYGLKIPVLRVRELQKVDMNGSSIYGIVEAAEKLSLKATALSGTWEELIEEIANKEIILPLIVHVVVSDQLQHFIVVWKITQKRVKIFDPAVGNKTYSIEEFKKIWTGYVINLEKAENFSSQNLKKGYFYKFIELLLNNKILILKILLFSFLISGLTLLVTVTYQQIVDNFIMNPVHNVVQKANYLFMCLVLVILFRMLLTLLRGFQVSRLSKILEYELLNKLFTRLKLLTTDFYQSRKTGEIIDRYYDVKKIRDMFSTTIIATFLDIIMAIVSGIAIFCVNDILFFVLMAVAIIYVVNAFCFKSPLYKINRTIAESEAQTTSILKECIDGIEEIKIFDSKKYIINGLTGKAHRMILSTWKGNKINTLNWSISDTIESIASLLVFWIGSVCVIKGTMSLGTLIVVVMLAGYLLTPIGELIEMQNQFSELVVALDRLNDIFEAETEAVSNKEIIFEKKICEVSFSNVCFSYGYNDLLLSNINIEIAEGSKVAFVGRSGSGKTTLAKLLMKFYKTNSGIIRIEGEDIESIPNNILYEKVSYVSQDVFLFSKSILDNICMGEEIDVNRLNEVIKYCEIESIIKDSPYGLNTILNENAINLSGGEKQRLGVARALARNPDILIFDEITNGLDSITEDSLLKAIDLLCPKTTCVFITHQLKSIEMVDYIYVLEKGTILEEGKHQELLMKKGVYWNMYKSD